jgi:hypothetical protein
VAPKATSGPSPASAIARANSSGSLSTRTEHFSRSVRAHNDRAPGVPVDTHYWPNSCSCMGVFLLCREGCGSLPPSVLTLGPLRQSEVPDFFPPALATGFRLQQTAPARSARQGGYTLPQRRQKSICRVVGVTFMSIFVSLMPLPDNSFSAVAGRTSHTKMAKVLTPGNDYA